MKALWTYVAVAGFALSLGGAAFAECAGLHGQQSVEADVPVTVASGTATTAGSTDGEK